MASETTPESVEAYKQGYIDVDEAEVAYKSRITLGYSTAPNPNHPEWSADRGLTWSQGNGGAALALMDGVGAGGKASAEAAQIVVNNVKRLLLTRLEKSGLEEGENVGLMSVQKAENLLRWILVRSAKSIRRIQNSIDFQADTTALLCTTCQDAKGVRKLFTVHVGDTVLYVLRSAQLPHW